MLRDYAEAIGRFRTAGRGACRNERGRAAGLRLCSQKTARQRLPRRSRRPEVRHTGGKRDTGMPNLMKGGMQTKETKTAKELETEISNHLGGLEVTVYNEPMSGWTATVFAPPADVAKHQQIVQIVSELRAKYDLKEQPETADLAPSETTMPFAEPGGTRGQ